jgi:hypothetical protein
MLVPFSSSACATKTSCNQSAIRSQSIALSISQGFFGAVPSHPALKHQALPAAHRESIRIDAKRIDSTNQPEIRHEPDAY